MSTWDNVTCGWPLEEAWLSRYILIFSNVWLVDSHSKNHHKLGTTNFINKKQSIIKCKKIGAWKETLFNIPHVMIFVSITCWPNPHAIYQASAIELSVWSIHVLQKWDECPNLENQLMRSSKGSKVLKNLIGYWKGPCSSTMKATLVNTCSHPKNRLIKEAWWLEWYHKIHKSPFYHFF